MASQTFRFRDGIAEVNNGDYCYIYNINWRGDMQPGKVQITCLGYKYMTVLDQYGKEYKFSYHGQEAGESSRNHLWSTLEARNSANRRGKLLFRIKQFLSHTPESSFTLEQLTQVSKALEMEY
jgi:hypothetical protein